MTNEKKLFSKEKISHITKTYGIILVLVVMFIIAAILDENFFTLKNITNVIRQVSINGIIAIGMTFIILSGCIDLSVGSVAAMNGLLVLLLPMKFGVPLWLSIIIVLVAGLVIGFINGFSVYKGMPAFIMTLATQTSVRGIAYIINNGSPATTSNEAFKWIGQGDLAGIPVTVIIYILLIALAYFILKKTVFGRSVYALGGNAEAARLSGINTRNMRISVFMISSLMATVAAIVLAARLGATDPTLGENYHADAISATVIGGTAMSGGQGNILLTTVGVLIIGILGNILNLLGVSSYMQQILKGVIIFLAVASDTWKKKN